MSDEPVLACDFSTTYASTGVGVRDIRFEVGAGEIFGVAGESGSGKSTLALSVCALAARRGARTSGTIRFCGRDLLSLRERELRRIRGREIGWVSQSSGSALNPALRVEAHFAEVWRAHNSNGLWQAGAGPLLQRLRIPATQEIYRRFPGELSVGMAQRVVVALGLLHGPRLLVADEPTSALDLATQAELLGLLRDLRQERALSVLFISHDLLALMSICDRIAVLRRGEVLEVLPALSFLESAQHPYSRELASSLKSLLPGGRTEGTGTVSVAGP